MIVVVGSPAWRPGEAAGPAGRTCEIALATAARGARAEVVGRIGDDPAGDALVLALATGGVGHAAVLRDPARPTPVLATPEPSDARPAPDHAQAGADDAVAEPPFADPDDAVAPPRAALPAGSPRLERADVALGLSYLTAFSVLVVADDAPPDVVPACVDGAAFAGAQLVVLVPEGAPVPPALPAAATVLAAPDAEDDGAFARVVGAYAAGLDAGRDPAEAFRAAASDAGWDRAEDAGSA